MNGGFYTALVTVLTAIVGVAIVATIVSKNAQTPQVISSFWGGFSDSLRAATGPVTGGGGNASSGYGGVANIGTMMLPAFGSFANI